MQDLLRSFGLPSNVFLPKECEDEIWDVVVAYRKTYRWCEDKRMRVREDLARQQIQRGEYYTPEAWERVQLDLGERVETYRTKVEGKEVIVPIWKDMKDKKCKALAEKRWKAWHETIANIRKIFEECIDQSSLPRAWEQTQDQLHPKVLLELGTREILNWLGLSPFVRLELNDEESVVAVVEEYRAQYEALELERAKIVADIIEHKSRAGEYYDGETLIKVYLDPRVVERREEIRPMRVNGKQVYVTVGLRDDPRLREIGYEKAQLFADTVTTLRSIVEKYEKPKQVTKRWEREQTAIGKEGK